MKMPKIAIMGLDNAGKTSIIKVIQYNFSNICKVVPTSGVERHFLEFLGTKLSIWDYGGQEKYRNKYIEDSQNYLKNVGYLLYVIDMADEIRYSQSLEYLKKIFDILAKSKNNFHLNIFFHKFDEETNQHYIDNTKKLLYEIVKLMGDKAVPVHYFNTSIHNPYSIISSLSTPIFEHEGIVKPLSKSLENFLNRWELEGISLYTESLIEIAKYSGKISISQKCRNDILTYLKRYSDVLNYITELDKNCDGMTIHLSKFSLNSIENNISLFLVWGTQSVMNRHFEDDIFELMENIKQLIGKINILSPIIN